MPQDITVVDDKGNELRWDGYAWKPVPPETPKSQTKKSPSTLDNPYGIQYGVVPKEKGKSPTAKDVGQAVRSVLGGFAAFPVSTAVSLNAMTPGAGKATLPPEAAEMAGQRAGQFITGVPETPEAQDVAAGVGAIPNTIFGPISAAIDGSAKILFPKDKGGQAMVRAILSGGLFFAPLLTKGVLGKGGKITPKDIVDIKAATEKAKAAPTSTRLQSPPAGTGNPTADAAALAQFTAQQQARAAAQPVNSPGIAAAPPPGITTAPPPPIQPGAIAPFQVAPIPPIRTTPPSGWGMRFRNAGAAFKDVASPLYAKLVNQYNPIERLGKEAKKQGVALDPADNPRNLVRSWLGEPEKINAMLDNGISKVNPDGTFTRLGEGLKPILKDYSEANPFKDVKIQEADFNRFFNATRVIEDLQRPKTPGGTDNIVTPQQVAAAQADLAALRATYGPDFANFERTAPRIYKFQNDVLDYCVDRGLFSLDEVDAIKSRNQHYIPFDRVVEAGEQSGIIPKASSRFSEAGSGMRRIKGSEKATHPAVGSIVKNTHRLIDAADRNAIAISVSKLADIFPDQIKIVPGKSRAIPLSPDEIAKVGGQGDLTIFRASQSPPTPTSVRFKLNGEHKWMSLSPELHKAMMNLTADTTDLFTKIMSYPKQWLQVGATITPDFIMRNPIRDQFTAFQQTQVGFKPFLDIPKSLFSLAKKGDLYNEYLMSGSPHAGLVSMNRTSLAKAYKQFVQNPSWLRRLNPILDLQDLSEAMEKSTRYAVYERARKTGQSPLEAGVTSSESTVDFRIHGSGTGFARKTIPFLNAGIQGLDRFPRAYKADPVGMTAKGIATITIPSIILHELNKDNPRVQEQKQYIKDLFWTIDIGDDKPLVYIPKPFMAGQLFGTAIERALDWAQSKDPDGFGKEISKMVGPILEASSPGGGDVATSIIPVAIKPIVENLADWSFFRGVPIVPESKSGYPKEEQYGPYASETSKFIGKQINQSPAKIDNLISGWFGGMGRYGTQIADVGLKATGLAEKGGPKKPFDISDLPVLKSFLSKPEYALQQQSIQDFYDRMKEVQSWRSSMASADKSGNAKRVREIEREHPEFELAKDYEKQAKEFSELRREMEATSMSKSLSTSQKKAKMNAMARNIVQMAREMNSEYDRVRKGAK